MTIAARKYGHLKIRKEIFWGRVEWVVKEKIGNHYLPIFVGKDFTSIMHFLRAIS